MTRLASCTALLLGLFCLFILIGLVALGVDGLHAAQTMGGMLATPVP